MFGISFTLPTRAFTAKPERPTLPSNKHLHLLFQNGTHPSLMTCYELLWVTQHGSLTTACTKCGLLSRHELSAAKPIFRCEYGFCGHREVLPIPFVGTQSKVTLQQYLLLLMLIQDNPDIALAQLAKNVGVSWPTARDMYKKLKARL